MTDVPALKVVADQTIPTFPPEPWDLRGQLHASAFLVPLHEVPVDLPPGCRPVRVGRMGVVAAIWVNYEPGGVMQYRELMTTLLVRHGRRLLPTITHIWVDSPSSRDGGRALWGIPKELATFDFDGTEFAAHDDEGPLASGSVTPVAALPGRWPTNFRVAQWLGGAAKFSPVHSRAAIVISRASFHADPTGPLAFLSGRRPLVSFTLRDFRMSFGSRR
jgi:hypothetical protein